jgi:SAM-dependent methyltransferase
MIENISVSFNFDCEDDLDYIEEAYKNTLDDANIILRYANCLANKHEYKLACDLFLKIPDLNPQMCLKSYFNAGICAFMDDEFAKSSIYLKEGLKFNENHYDTHFVIGISYFHLGLFGRANTHWWAASRIKQTETIMNILKQFLLDDTHPERVALYPVCVGKGIDVGCGNRKTHPNAVGVDVLPKGVRGRYGSVAGKESTADVIASGDNLYYFKNNELDYVVQRHNLEHYQDPIRALQEWKRVVKPGGVIGMVVPDDENCDTIHLDKTHKHVFTQSSLRRIIELIGGLNIVYMGGLLKNWSFICIIQKTEGMGGSVALFDYERVINQFEGKQLENQASIYTARNQPQLSRQCLFLLNRDIE